MDDRPFFSPPNLKQNNKSKVGSAVRMRCLPAGCVFLSEHGLCMIVSLLGSFSVQAFVCRYCRVISAVFSNHSGA